MNNLEIIMMLVWVYLTLGFFTAVVCGDQKHLRYVDTDVPVYNRKFFGIIFVAGLYWLAGILWVLWQILAGIGEAIYAIFTKNQ